MNCWEKKIVVTGKESSALKSYSHLTADKINETKNRTSSYLKSTTGSPGFKLEAEMCSELFLLRLKCF